MLNDAAATARGYDVLHGIFRGADDPSMKAAVEGGLVALASNLDTVAAAERFDTLMKTLATVTERESERNTLQAVGWNLAALAGRLDTPAAEMRFVELAGLLGKANTWVAWNDVGMVLAVLATRLDSATARHYSQALIGILGEAAHNPAMEAAAGGLEALAGRLDAAAAAIAFDALVAALSKATHKDVLRAAGRGLAALAGRLDVETVAREAESLIGRIDKLTETYDFEPASLGLSALAESLDVDVRIRACDSLLHAISRTDKPGIKVAAISTSFAFVNQLITANAVKCRDRITQATAELMDDALLNIKLNGYGDSWTLALDCLGPMLAESTRTGELMPASFFDSDYQTWRKMPVHSILGFTGDLPAVARCLAHPSCVGEVRQAVLRRLEQLAVPPTADQQFRALVPSVISGLAEPSTAGVLAASRATAWERHRKFRTIWDAVAWLRQHHPEIDLDTPYKSARAR